MNIRDINSAIMYGQFTNEELDSIVGALKFARASLARKTFREVRLQSTVRWTSDKHPRGMTGTVVKLGRKYITVSTGTGLWQVPANMLTVAE